MNTKEMTRERISALADGELAEQHLDAVLATLRQPNNQTDWEIYHQIGDVLRSDDMAVTLSPGFAARMAARLETEPTIIAPAISMPANETGSGQVSAPMARSQLKRWGMPSMVAAAAMATIAFVTTPHLMVAMKSEPQISDATRVASANSQEAAVPVSEEVMLRDPRIDDYLLAHQRFSPSVFSAAQYTHSATFVTDSNI